MIIETALICLAINIYHEARDQPIPGQYGVALVTMNRAKSEERICHETFRHKQFSWTGDVVKVQGGWKLPEHMRPRTKDPIEAHAWDRAKTIAATALDGQMQDITLGADHYHRIDVSPAWAPRMKRVKRIGSHIFYTSQVKPSR
jgi:N-acetylmuramoyl-L-alanine amidase